MFYYIWNLCYNIRNIYVIADLNMVESFKDLNILENKCSNNN